MSREQIIKMGGLAVVFVTMIITLGLTSSERNQVICSNVRVMFDSKEQFVTSGQIEKIVAENSKGFMGALIDTLNTNALESKIEEHPWVLNAEVFKGPIQTDSSSHVGGLKVYIEQEIPLLRVVAGAKEFYVNKNGKHLPYSSSCTASVLVVTGHVNDVLLQNKLLPFVAYLNTNEFWKALIEQVDVQNDETLVLVPRAGDHKILFGKVENVETKLRNLKAVYTQGFINGAWNKYKSVSLEFNNQVICTLK